MFEIFLMQARFFPDQSFGARSESQRRHTAERTRKTAIARTKEKKENPRDEKVAVILYQVRRKQNELTARRDERMNFRDGAGNGSRSRQRSGTEAAEIRKQPQRNSSICHCLYQLSALAKPALIQPCQNFAPLRSATIGLAKQPKILDFGLKKKVSPGARGGCNAKPCGHQEFFGNGAAHGAGGYFFAESQRTDTP